MKDRSRAAVALARLGLKHEAIADDLDVTRQAVQQYLSGEKKPSKPKRKIAKEKYGIEEAWWDEEPESVVVVVPPADGPKGVFDLAAELKTEAWQLLAELKAGREKSTFSERGKALAHVSAMLERIQRSTSAEALGRELVALPIWKRIEAAIFEGLKEHPEAARAVKTKLEQLDDEDGAA